jgi:TPR repeat protein
MRYQFPDQHWRPIVKNWFNPAEHGSNRWRANLLHSNLQYDDWVYYPHDALINLTVEAKLTNDTTPLLTITTTSDFTPPRPKTSTNNPEFLEPYQDFMGVSVEPNLPCRVSKGEIQSNTTRESAIKDFSFTDPKKGEKQIYSIKQNQYYHGGLSYQYEYANPDSSMHRYGRIPDYFSQPPHLATHMLRYNTSQTYELSRTNLTNSSISVDVNLTHRLVAMSIWRWCANHWFINTAIINYQFNILLSHDTTIGEVKVSTPNCSKSAVDEKTMGHVQHVEYYKNDLWRSYNPPLEEIKRTNNNQLVDLPPNPEYIYLIADAYKNKNQLQKACLYYAIAAQGKHVASQQQLDTLLDSNEITVEDIIELGKKYRECSDGLTKDDAKAKMCFTKALKKNKCWKVYYQLALMHLVNTNDGVEKNIFLATYYFQLVAQYGNALLADEKIESILNAHETTENELFSIATMYQNGRDELTKNVDLALKFKKKAAERNSLSAVIELAHFYQVNHDGVSKNPTLAFSYYLQAAKLGSRDALVPLEILGEEVTAENQSKLSQLFRGTLFNDQRRALYWETKANEVSQFQLKK